MNEQFEVAVAVIELPEPVRKLAEASGLPLEESKALAIGFNSFFIDLDELKFRIDSEINMDNPGPEDELKAGEFRKLIKKQRTSANAWKEQANEKPLAIQRLNNGIFKLVEDNTKPLEDALSRVEKAAQIREATRLTAIEKERKLALEPFGTDTEFHDLKNMPEERWLLFFEKEKNAFEAINAQKELRKIKDQLHENRKAIALTIYHTDMYFGDLSEEDFVKLMNDWTEEKAEAEQKAEIYRLQQEKQLAIETLERNRLKELSELGLVYPAKNGDNLGELSSQEYELVKAVLVFEKEQQEKLLKEAAQTQRLMKEAQDKAEAEAKRKKAEEEEIERLEKIRLQQEEEARILAEQAPDKDKLIKFMADLRALKFPDLNSEKGIVAEQYIKGKIMSLYESIEKMVDKM